MTGDSSASLLAADLILDFSQSGVSADKIDISTIDARAATAGNEAFVLLAEGAAFTAEGQISWLRNAAANETILSFNTAGVGAAEMAIRISGQLTLTADNFLL